MNYSAAEIMRIKGLKSTEIVNVLGYADSEYVAHRENISFFPRVASSAAAGAGTGADSSSTKNAKSMVAASQEPKSLGWRHV